MFFFWVQIIYSYPLIMSAASLHFLTLFVFSLSSFFLFHFQSIKQVNCFLISSLLNLLFFVELSSYPFWIFEQKIVLSLWIYKIFTSKNTISDLILTLYQNSWVKCFKYCFLFEPSLHNQRCKSSPLPLFL